MHKIETLVLLNYLCDDICWKKGLNIPNGNQTPLIEEGQTI